MSWFGRLWGAKRHPREGDVLAVDGAVTAEAEAIETARRAAEEAGYSWVAPIQAELLHHRGRACWFVSTRAHSRGHRVTVAIDDATRAVVRIDVLPR